MAAVLALLVTAGIAVAAGDSFNFNSPLSGAEEAPIPRDTNARGNAVYMLNRDGTAIEYMLMVANIENVFMAHIHRGPAGTAGPIVVWLYPSTAPGVQAPKGGGRINGVIAQGTITAADFTGPLAGQPLSALVDLLRNGGVYTNVHTDDGDLVLNEGPGDFPAGEIRGQIKENGPG
ncbi:MAG: CHRD domain-containing protein [Gaiellaceae bacterium]